MSYNTISQQADYWNMGEAPRQPQLNKAQAYLRAAERACFMCVLDTFKSKISSDCLITEKLLRAADSAGAGHQQRGPPALLWPRHQRGLPLWQGQELMLKPPLGPRWCRRISCLLFTAGRQQHPLLWGDRRGSVHPLPVHLQQQREPEGDGLDAQEGPGDQQMWNCQVVKEA